MFLSILKQVSKLTLLTHLIRTSITILKKLIGTGVRKAVSSIPLSKKYMKILQKQLRQHNWEHILTVGVLIASCLALSQSSDIFAVLGKGFLKTKQKADLTDGSEERVLNDKKTRIINITWAVFSSLKCREDPTQATRSHWVGFGINSFLSLLFLPRLSFKFQISMLQSLDFQWNFLETISRGSSCATQWHSLPLLACFSTFFGVRQIAVDTSQPELPNANPFIGRAVSRMFASSEDVTVEFNRGNWKSICRLV